jgi:hypothetical protein
MTIAINSIKRVVERKELLDTGIEARARLKFLVGSSGLLS